KVNKVNKISNNKGEDVYMLNNKLKSLLIITIGLVLVVAGCGKKDEENAERLEDVETTVEALFNEEGTDWSSHVTAEELDEVEEMIKEEEDADFSEENAELFESIKTQYNLAKSMFSFDTQVAKLLDDGVVSKDVSKDYIEDLLGELDVFKGMDLFVERQNESLEEAMNQLVEIEEATKLVDALFNDKGKVKKKASRKAEKKATKAVDKLLNEDVKEELLERLKEVGKVITKAEKKAEEKKLAEE